MFTYKKASYKIFTLDPKFCWARPDNIPSLYCSKIQHLFPFRLEMNFDHS